MAGLPDVLPSAVTGDVSILMDVVISSEGDVTDEVVVSAVVVISGEVDISGVLVGSAVLVGSNGLVVPDKEIISGMAMDMGMDMKSRAGQLMGEDSMSCHSGSLPAEQSGLEGSQGALKRTVSDGGRGYLLCSPLLWCPIPLW